jgi:adenine-specific DNA-methyltransferase
VKQTTTPAQERLLSDTPDALDSTSVEKYRFEPIKGYPMLHWRGKRPFVSTQYYPAQLKEVHGEEVAGWRSKLFWGDNLQVMSHLLKEFRAAIDLIYIDPPYDSNATYVRKLARKGRTAVSDASNFEDKQYQDIWTQDEYLQFMYERLTLARELLSGTGSLFLHCDYRKTHHLRCILEEIFGPQALVCEIIWQSTVFTGSSKAIANKYPVNHNTIYWFKKGPEYQFNKPRLQYSEQHLKRFVNPDGDPKGPWQSVALKTYSDETFARLKAEGALIAPQRDGAGWRYKFYLSDAKGKVLETLWSDVNMENSMSADRTGYPTQKPTSLLERIVSAHSAPGDLVMDFFMGSGTTQAVAMQLGRRFIGADINLGAVQTTTRRLIGVSDDLRAKSLSDEAGFFTGFEVYNVNHYDIFRNPAQARDLLLEALEVQRLEFSSVFDGEKDGRMVKIMPVNRIATRADLNELIAGVDYKVWERRQSESPSRAVEKITLVCMGHEPDLRNQLELATRPFKIDVEVMDILRDRADLEFRRDAQAKLIIKNGDLLVERFYPMNLLQKLSLQEESAGDWRELVESVLIDWNYDGAVLRPAVVDIPGKDAVVKGAYQIPDCARTIRVKITDLLSESWEGSISDD